VWCVVASGGVWWWVAVGSGVWVCVLCVWWILVCVRAWCVWCVVIILVCCGVWWWFVVRLSLVRGEAISTLPVSILSLTPVIAYCGFTISTTIYLLVDFCFAASRVVSLGVLAGCNLTVSFCCSFHMRGLQAGCLSLELSRAATLTPLLNSRGLQL
jgi:hypothetical protein